MLETFSLEYPLVRIDQSPFAVSGESHSPEFDSPPVWCSPNDLAFVTGKIPNSRKSRIALTVIVLDRDSEFAGWKLLAPLVIQSESKSRSAVASTWLEGVSEFGHGNTVDESLIDLITSLGEYRQSLEHQEALLGDSALLELTLLRKMISPTPDS